MLLLLLLHSVEHLSFYRGLSNSLVLGKLVFLNEGLGFIIADILKQSLLGCFHHFLLFRKLLFFKAFLTPEEVGIVRSLLYVLSKDYFDRWEVSILLALDVRVGT